MTESATVARTGLESLWVLGHRVTPITVDGRTVALEVATPPGVPGPPPHRHEDCTEFFFVTVGSFGVMKDGVWSSLAPGDHVEIPAGVVHSFRNDGDDEVRVITGFEPMGFEGFFREFGHDASRPGAFEASVSDESIRRVVDGCGRYGMIIAPADGPEATR
jgi:quercetin dioxygenase-like cupin family protein